jgi:ABC-type branched-subunit amino acid transport system ATPase component
MLEIRGLRAGYGLSQVLDGVDVEVPDGAFVAILGRNGMGKTTLCRSIMSLDPPTVTGGSIACEQQMLSIARALMTNPRLLIMDEPSEGLAPIVLEAVAEQLQQLKQGAMGLLLVEQNYSLAVRLADIAFVLENGRVVFHGTADEREAEGEVKQRYLGVGV